MNARAHNSAIAELVHPVDAVPAGARILRTVPEIEEIRGAWTQLLRHPNADIDLFLSEISSRPQILRPHVILLNRLGIPETILVGRLEIGRMDFRIGYASLLSRQARTLTFIHGGLLGNCSSNTSDILVQEVMNCLRRGEADVAFFNHLRADSPLPASLRRVPSLMSRDFLPAMQIHRSMSLPATAQEFWGRLSPKVRKNQKWQAKKLVQDYSGDVKIDCVTETSGLERMIQDVEEIAKKTYQRALRVGFVDDEDTRRRLSLRARKGWFRGYVLYVANSPCAFWLGTVCNGVFHSDYMGYDPAFSKHSPGMYLITRIIEQLCEAEGEQRISSIDFGLGDAEYKRILGDILWEDTTTYLFAPTLRALGLNAIRTPILFADALGRKVLERTQLVAKVKKKWRGSRAATAHRDQIGELPPSSRIQQEPEKQNAVNAE